MKKIWTLLLICSAIGASAQDSIKVFEKGKTFLSIGYGFIPVYSLHLDENNGVYEPFKGVTGPFYLKYEYCTSNNSTFGANLVYVKQYVEQNHGIDYYYSYKHETFFQSFCFLLRFNDCYPLTKRTYYYYGVGLGYKYTEWKNVATNLATQEETVSYRYGTSEDGLTGFPVAFEATIGIRHLFNPHLGFYFETGAAKSIFQCGMVYKI